MNVEELRAAAQAFVSHMDGPEPRRGLWTTLKADREAIRTALAASSTPEPSGEQIEAWRKWEARDKSKDVLTLAPSTEPALDEGLREAARVIDGAMLPRELGPGAQATRRYLSRLILTRLAESQS